MIVEESGQIRGAPLIGPVPTYGEIDDAVIVDVPHADLVYSTTALDETGSGDPVAEDDRGPVVAEPVGRVGGGELLSDGVIFQTTAAAFPPVAHTGETPGLETGGHLPPNMYDGPDRIACGDQDNLVFARGGDDTVSGGRGDDFLFGQEGDDVVSGGSGHDALGGGVGDDTLRGGAGHDRVSGNDGDDRLSGGSGDDEVGGGRGDDVLAGGAGNDTLSGGRGEDRLAGEAGDDQLRGGADADLFLIAPGGRDVILDFNAAEDVLDFRNAPVADLDALAEIATERHGRLVVDFGDGERLVLKGVDLDHLTAANTVFAHADDLV